MYLLFLLGLGKTQAKFSIKFNPRRQEYNQSLQRTLKVPLTSVVMFPKYKVEEGRTELACFWLAG